MAEVISTLSTPWKKLYVTDATDDPFPSVIPTVTEPTGDGVLDLGFGGAVTANALKILAIGTGADNATLQFRVYGFTFYEVPNLRRLWIPTLLCGIQCALSAIVGIANSSLTNSYRFADTMTVDIGNTNVSLEVLSNAADLSCAHCIVDVKGYQKAKIVTDLGTATAANFFVSKL